MLRGLNVVIMFSIDWKLRSRVVTDGAEATTRRGIHFSLVSREIIADSVETVMMAERFVVRM